MRLNQFQYLDSLEKNRSFTKAAENLFVTQPTISNAIHELEEELNCELIIRNRTGIDFTEKGFEILNEARAILLSVQHIEEIAKQDSSLLQCLHVGANPHLCNMLIYPSIVDLKLKYPTLEFVANAGKSSQLLKDVDSRKLDMAVVTLPYILPEEIKITKKHGVQYYDLFQDTLVFACRPAHPILNEKTITEKNIVNYPLAYYLDAIEEEVVYILKKYQYSKSITHIGEIISIRKYLSQSDAIAPMALSSIINGNRNLPDKLVPFAIAGNDWRLPVCLIYKDDCLNQAKEIFFKQIVKRSVDYKIDITTAQKKQIE